jgi:hypothetical protein
VRIRSIIETVHIATALHKLDISFGCRYISTNQSLSAFHSPTTLPPPTNPHISHPSDWYPHMSPTYKSRRRPLPFPPPPTFVCAIPLPFARTPQRGHSELALGGNIFRSHPHTLHLLPSHVDLCNRHGRLPSIALYNRTNETRKSALNSVSTVCLCA